jgi:very-short-patch-repair endonuclease
MPSPFLAETAFSRPTGGKPQTRPSDGTIARLAGRQFGVVTRAQLIELGLGEDAIDSRLARGRLHRLHRGVYSVGHAIVPKEGRWLAAVLRLGDGAVLSHGSAAEVWGLRRAEQSRRIDVAAPRPARSPRGICRHCLQLMPEEMTVRHRIPVTTLTRTILDIAGGSSAEALEGTIREAEYRYRLRLAGLETMMRRNPGRRGARVLDECLRRLGGGPSGRARSKMELKFAGLLAGTDLPQPELNVLVDLGHRMIEADCLWRDQRLIVELDGGRAHRTRAAFESDRERDRHLQASGWRTVRVTWRQLDEPQPLLADLRSLLAANLLFPAT